MILFWIAGMLFTLGAFFGNKQDEELTKKEMIFFAIAVLVAWPFVLGFAIMPGDGGRK